MKKIHYVYITTNLINGKQYVGDHTIKYREKYYIGSGTILEHAIKKYGIHNFFKEILEWFPTRKEAFYSQEKYIKLFNTLTPYGYNISPSGGMNESGGLHSEESNEKNRQSHIGKPVWSEGKKFTEIHRKNLSISRKINKCAAGEKNGMYGKHHKKESNQKNREKHINKKHTSESKQKISISLKGEKNPMFKKSFYDIWLTKFGKEEANKLLNNFKYKQRQTAAKKEIKICPHCGISGKGTGIVRYHFDNCKLKKGE